ncbi:hypothetical protein H5996_01270 [Faecalicoccus pleomorphus]|uniref:hypothetical protein n=1 Tax=Faecalicoccus pleomorphus TaxID=1323 RepID=UPI00195F352D|nr:hypothetical protein [Faecalicoccus pleomorphus]MBM6764535.1 hypothetical protein [Faecalicoccus pleomorphus]
MLTEKECREALENLKEKVNGETVDAVVCFKELIDEHFDNPPLTIDDLKRDQEVYFKDYGETVLIRGVDKEKNLVFLSAIDRKCELEYEFEPNCFYRKKVNK